MNWQTIRYPVVLFLAALMLVGLVGFCRSMSLALQNIADQGDLYRRSPGCVRDVPDVDPSLPPCTVAPVTIVGLMVYNTRAGGGALTVRDRNGKTWTYDQVYPQFMAGRKQGEIIYAQTWRGKVMGLSAGQLRYTVVKLPPRTFQNFIIAGFWLLVTVLIAVWPTRLAVTRWRPLEPGYGPFHRAS